MLLQVSDFESSIKERNMKFGDGAIEEKTPRPRRESSTKPDRPAGSG